jgi:glycosyltransferase involved in cell wall biosynthesis
MVQETKQITLFFRKLREAGNFSIETSFGEMMRNFPPGSGFVLKKFTSSHLSNGVISRLRGMREAARNAGMVNHVTGDVHYLALALPGDNTILTIHDCGFMSHGNPLARQILKWFWLKLPVRHCRYVVVVSAATRRDILRYTRCDPEKVIVIPTVVAGGFSRVERPFNQDCPRILHVGLAPNKNFPRHVEALSGVRCELRIIGRLEEGHIRLLERHGVRYTCSYNISQEEMYKAYVDSDLLLFASTLEGFGMPIVEAQIVGRAVVTSNLSSMPEVAGDGACLVDPYSVSSIRQGVMRVINDPAYRASIIEAGYSNAARYDARAVAGEYERLYRRVISG